MILAVLTLFQKELKEILRDQRTLFASLSFSLAGPFVLVAVVYGIAAAGRPAPPGPFAWCPGSHASSLLARYLGDEGYRVQAGTAVCLSVPSGLSQRIRTGRPIEIGVRANLLHDGGSAERLADELRSFANVVADQRLMARGVAPSVASPLTVTMQNLAPVDATANSVISILALYFVMAPFFVGLASAIDATAGERERGTLEPLLVQPIAPATAIVAKWLALSLLALAGTVVTIALGFVALRGAPLADAGVTLHLAAAVALRASLIVFPLALLVAAMQLWVGLVAKTYKEGQSYLTLIAFIPMVLGVAAFKDVSPRFADLPLMHEVLGVKALLSGSTAPGSPVSTALSIALTVLMLVLAASRLRRAALVHA